TEPLGRDVGRTERTLMELRTGTAFGNDAGVVATFVFVAQPRQQLARPQNVVRDLLDELVGDRQKERDERLLVLGIDHQDVEANALRGRRIVEQAIALRLLE